MCVLSQKKDRTVRRLEKSIARYEATEDRPTHYHGRPRLVCCDIDYSHLLLCCCCSCHHSCTDVHNMEDGPHPPPKGTLVDSIQYYTVELDHANTEFCVLQRQKMAIADASNRSLDSNVWFYSTVQRIVFT